MAKLIVCGDNTHRLRPYVNENEKNRLKENGKSQISQVNIHGITETTGFQWILFRSSGFI